MMRQLPVFIFIVILAAAGGSFLFSLNTLREKATRTFSETQSPNYFIQERSRLRERINDIGASGAYEELKRDYGAESFSNQHSIIHIFGELLYENGGVGMIGVCDGTFNFGCFHGFFGRAVAREGIEIVKEADRVCAEMFGTKNGPCQHGIGHGILEYVGQDNLVQALLACGNTEQRDHSFGCVSGVFMEYNVPIKFSSGGISSNIRPFSPNDPYAPCPFLPQEFREPCYYEMAQWWSKSVGFEKILEFCDHVVLSEEREACFRGVGKIAAPMSNYDVEKTKNLCEKITRKEGEFWCKIEASGALFMQPQTKGNAIQVCEEMPADFFNRCAGG